MTRPVLPQHRKKKRTGSPKSRMTAKTGSPNPWTGQGRRVDGTFKKSKRNKYNAKGRYIDGKWFASKAEGDRYEQLLAMEKKGMIDEIECQPSFPCDVNGARICVYRADFRYRKKYGGMWKSVTEDVKGMVTDVYKIKKKLVEAIHKIEIHEIPGKWVSDQKTIMQTGDEITKTAR